MALSRRFPMPFEVAFPVGLYQITEVEPVLDYDKSTAERKVQQVDAETGLPLWQVTCLDPDPEAKKAQKTVSVKIPGKVQRNCSSCTSRHTADRTRRLNPIAHLYIDLARKTKKALDLKRSVFDDHRILNTQSGRHLLSSSNL